MDKLTLREVQLAELEILTETVMFLDKHGLRYMLAYGTLIGAIRHQGFIPWDDDIDVFMPREDYEKLKQIVAAGENVSEHISLRIPGEKGHKYPFIKAVHHGYIVDNTNDYLEGYEEELWVDIFPLNYVSENFSRFTKDLILLRLLAKITQYDVMKLGSGSTVKANILIPIAKIAAFFMGGYSKAAIFDDKVSYRMHKRYRNSKVVGDGCWDFRKVNYPADIFDKLIKHEFEGKEFYIPEKYDELLTLTYGNYMELPPVEKRQSHYLTVYKK